MSPTASTKSFKQKEVVWQQYRLCLSMAEHPILVGKHYLILETIQGPPGEEKKRKRKR